MALLLNKTLDLLLSSAHFRISIPSVILLMTGLLMIMSSSSEYSQAYHGAAFYFVIKQALMAMIGFILLLIAARMPITFWQSNALMILFLNLILLLLLFIPAIGKEVNASIRWMSLGVFSFQPSELLKLSMPLFYASYFCYLVNSKQNNNGLQFLLPLLLLGVVVALLLLQPDFASAVIYALFAIAIIFFAGMKIWHLFFAGFGVVAVLLPLVAIHPYRLNRFFCLSDNNIWERFYQECYQVGHSLVAIERGSLWGAGLGESIQKSFYLPEAYTDFVFAIIVEELGSVFGILLIGIFVYLLYNLFKLGLDSATQGNYFAAYFCVGVALIWGLQFVFNLGVSLSYLPVTGLTLPFISYGGSSLLVNLILLGIIMRLAVNMHDTYSTAQDVPRQEQQPNSGQSKESF